MAIKGLNTIVYVPLIKDDLTGIEYGTALKNLIGGQNLSASPNILSAKLMGDDKMLEEETAVESYTVTFNLAELGLEDRATLLGNNYEDGVLKEGADDTPIPIALGFKAPKSKTGGGGERRVWLLKGTGKPIADDYETKGENIAFKPTALEYTFMPRVHDNQIRFISDSNDTGAPENDKFFAIAYLKEGRVTA